MFACLKRDKQNNYWFTAITLMFGERRSRRLQASRWGPRSDRVEIALDRRSQGGYEIFETDCNGEGSRGPRPRNWRVAMSEFAKLLEMSGVSVIYDGDCPFCASYVALTKLRDAVGEVRLIDARGNRDLSRELLSRGFDLNDGMVVLHDRAVHFGGDATHVLARLAERTTLSGKILSAAFYSKRASNALYPALRFGRNLTLRLLGKSKIQ